MKIINQIEIDEYTVIEVSDQTYFGNYAVIEGKDKANMITTSLDEDGIYHAFKELNLI